MQSVASIGDNACAGIDLADRARLDEAAQILVDARGIIMMITDTVGHAMSNIGGSTSDFIKQKFGLDLKSRAEKIVESALWAAQSASTTGMDEESDSRPWNWFHKLAVTASGAGSGFFGAPGLLWDLPFTTGMILRSVSDIARTFPGENLSAEDTRRACIEVFAFGGPETDDDDADSGYWAARAGLSHFTIELLIKTVAPRFGIALSEKALAQMVPVAGAAAGAGLNYAFINYYQQMARVHFTVRDVERRTPDPSAVKPCFSSRVREVRQRRKMERKADVG